MSFRQKWLLRSFVGWTYFVWIVLVKNMITDHHHSWSFRLIHIGLAIISIALASLVWPLARLPQAPDLDGPGEGKITSRD